MSAGSAEPLFVMGTKLWSTRLAEQLERTGEFCSQGVYELDPRGVTKLLALFRSRWLIRVGVRPGVLRPRGILVDVICLLARWMGIRVVLYWIGSDVLQTLETYRSKSGWWQRFWLERAKAYRHAAGSPWLSEELVEIGIQAETLYFPSPLDAPREPPPFPDSFSVLTYIPDGRATFYGGEVIYGCAKEHPSIRFDVIAGTGSWVDAPLPNLNFHGWVKNMTDRYANCVVVVRLVKHDALGGTVREGWAHGRYVIYSYELEHTIHVPFGDQASLSLQLEALQQAFDKGELVLDRDAHDHATREFDEVLLADRFAQWLRKKPSGRVVQQ